MGAHCRHPHPGPGDAAWGVSRGCFSLPCNMGVPGPEGTAMGRAAHWGPPTPPREPHVPAASSWAAPGPSSPTRPSPLWKPGAGWIWHWIRSWSFQQQRGKKGGVSDGLATLAHAVPSSPHPRAGRHWELRGMSGADGASHGVTAMLCPCYLPGKDAGPPAATSWSLYRDADGSAGISTDRR